MALVEFRVETNIFSSHFLVSIKSVGIIVLGVQIHLTSLSSSYSFQITAFTALIVSEISAFISAFIPTDRQVPRSQSSSGRTSQRSHGQMDRSQRSHGQTCVHPDGQTDAIVYEISGFIRTDRQTKDIGHG